MSAEYKTLLELKEVTDHDCGNYTIGEVDFAIHGSVDEFLKKRGREGRNELILRLCDLINIVAQKYNDVQDRAVCEAKADIFWEPK